MLNTDYPNYYIAGDAASLNAQSNYSKFIMWDLLFMIFSAGLSIYNYQSAEAKTLYYIVSAILMFSALFISIILKTKRYEDTWYRGRALAESCKTLTWRYVTCSEYFEQNLSENEAQKKFSDRIKEIFNEFDDLSKELNAKQIKLPIITPEMLRVRQLPMQERKDYYLVNRIQEQIDWYSSKAENNKTKYEFWFILVIVFQILSLISISYLVKYPQSNINLVGLFSTISASGFSWLQLKKFQENKEAYTTATSELNFIRQMANQDFSENEFAKFVLDSENAMSREHTMWLAQKRM